MKHRSILTFKNTSIVFPVNFNKNMSDSTQNFLLEPDGTIYINTAYLYSQNNESNITRTKEYTVKEKKETIGADTIKQTFFNIQQNKWAIKYKWVKL